MAHKFHPETRQVKAEGLMMMIFVIGAVGALFIFTGVGAIVGAPLIVVAVFLAMIAAIRRH